MKNIRNIVCKTVAAVTAFTLAACCMSSLPAFVADAAEISGEATAVTDLAMIDDGYDVSVSDAALVIDLP